MARADRLAQPGTGANSGAAAQRVVVLRAGGGTTHRSAAAISPAGWPSWRRRDYATAAGNITLATRRQSGGSCPLREAAGSTASRWRANPTAQAWSPSAGRVLRHAARRAVTSGRSHAGRRTRWSRRVARISASSVSSLSRAENAFEGKNGADRIGIGDFAG